MPAASNETVTFLVAILGSTGFGIFVREFFAGIRKQRAGVASKEAQRKDDLVTRREEAETKAIEADKRAELQAHIADVERNNRYLADEHIALLRRKLVDQGMAIDQLPARPLYENTLTRAQIRKLAESSE